MGIFNNIFKSRSGKNKKAHKSRNSFREYDLSYKPVKAKPAPVIKNEGAVKGAAPVRNSKQGVTVKRLVVKKAASTSAVKKPEVNNAAAAEKNSASVLQDNNIMLTTTVSAEDLENLPDDSAARPTFNYDDGGMGGIDVSALDLSSLDDYLDDDISDEPEDNNIYSDDDDDYTFDADPSSIRLSDMDK